MNSPNMGGAGSTDSRRGSGDPTGGDQGRDTARACGKKVAQEVGLPPVSIQWCTSDSLMRMYLPFRTQGNVPLRAAVYNQESGTRSNSAASGTVSNLGNVLSLTCSLPLPAVDGAA